ncbi:MAG: hypothetical protein HY760_07365 [Nitrospirae bacterium]|nr:hypothetical protein [Nitrospirota bacterium]
MPVGPLNEFHEPTLFYSVERPYVQTYLIPTSWAEGGAGIHGSPLPGLKYRVYLVSGLDAAGFSDSTGIRSGRKKMANAPSEDLAWVGRLEYVGIPGLRIGGSYYSGGADARKLTTLDGAGVTLVEGDLRYQIAGFEIQGVYVSATVDEAAKISAVTGKTIGSKQEGWYAEGAYHLLRSLNSDADRDLVVFVRHEAFNTQKEVDSGAANPADDRQILTYGIAYFPHPDVAVKIDQERWKDEADQEEERINLGLAYMF